MDLSRREFPRKATTFSVSNDRSEEGVPDIAAGFKDLLDHFDRLLMLHARDADVVVALERAKSLAQHGLQLARKLSD